MPRSSRARFPRGPGKRGHDVHLLLGAFIPVRQRERGQADIPAEPGRGETFPWGACTEGIFDSHPAGVRGQSVPDPALATTTWSLLQFRRHATCASCGAGTRRWRGCAGFRSESAHAMEAVLFSKQAVDLDHRGAHLPAVRWTPRARPAAPIAWLGDLAPV